MSWFASWKQHENYQPKQEGQQPQKSNKKEGPTWTVTDAERIVYEEYIKLWETGLWKANDQYTQKFQDLEAAVLRSLDAMIREQLIADQLVYVPVFNSPPFVSIVETIVASCSRKLPDGKFAYMLQNDGYIPQQFRGYARLAYENSASGQYPRGYIFPRFASSDKLIRALFHNNEVMFCPASIALVLA